MLDISTSEKNIKQKLCVVAILKDEEPFLDEWLLYHRMMGVDHFFLYDDTPGHPLQEFLKPHQQFTTVINWAGLGKFNNSYSKQLNAYKDALERYISDFEWAAFIDADEFIVIKNNETIVQFLDDFKDAVSISLHWHIFGHNGFYDDPPGLITASLTRRMFNSSNRFKSIHRPESIRFFHSAHSCKLKYGTRVDANNLKFHSELYEGKSDKALINHYQCRSFKRWMGRVKRGRVSCADPDNIPLEKMWMHDEELCLKQFVTTVALNKNEYVDEYMLKYRSFLEKELSKIQR